MSIARGVNIMANQTLKWLLVGPGDIARSRVAPALTSAERSELVAVCGSKRRTSAEELAAKHQVKLVYDDLDEALEKSGADAVYIATPHRLHVDMLKRSLAAGKHVFCEKPLGINAGECRDAVRAVRNAPDLKAGCSNYRLFTRQFRTLEKILQSGEAGELLGAWMQDEEPYYNPGNHPLLKSWGANPELSFGFYLINLSQKLFGDPEEVFCSASGFNCDNRSEYDLDDLQNIILRFPGGKQVTILLNFTARNVPVHHAYSFICSKGRIVFPACPPHYDEPIRLITSGRVLTLEDSVTGTDGKRPNWHLPMVQNFVDTVLNGGTPHCTVESAAMTAVITEAIERSAVSGRWETVPALL
ncbi:MAG: Gfo/Idh/MocA family oxidoreductase [Lentisphaerae bacterium]|nr:Gfo/Idh/MocA family oxidoreductase [Lentisphaerota bacterium]